MINQNNLSFTFNFFTTRENEVLTLIVNEYTTREIADQLFLSPETIKSHRASIMLKLDAKNVAGIVREALLRSFVNISQNSIAKIS